MKKLLFIVLLVVVLLVACSAEEHQPSEYPTCEATAKRETNGDT